MVTACEGDKQPWNRHQEKFWFRCKLWSWCINLPFFKNLNLEKDYLLKKSLIIGLFAIFSLLQQKLPDLVWTCSWFHLSFFHVLCLIFSPYYWLFVLQTRDYTKLVCHSILVYVAWWYVLGNKVGKALFSFLWVLVCEGYVTLALVKYHGYAIHS